MSHSTTTSPGKALKPSEFGYRTIRARTRSERRSVKDKAAIEKERLNQRIGWEAKINKLNAPEHPSQLTSCPEGGAGYLSNSDRFHSDTVGEEYALRQEARAKLLKAQEYKRYQSHKRDEDRWNSAEEKLRKEDEYFQRLREDPRKAQSNKTSVAYDIQSLQYLQNTEGEQQKYVDDMVRYRAELRSNQLIVKGDSRAKYNIINGSDRDALKEPPLPPKPNSLQGPNPIYSARVDKRVS